MKVETIQNSRLAVGGGPSQLSDPTQPTAIGSVGTGVELSGRQVWLDSEGSGSVRPYLAGLAGQGACGQGRHATTRLGATGVPKVGKGAVRCALGRQGWVCPYR